MITECDISSTVSKSPTTSPISLSSLKLHADKIQTCIQNICIAIQNVQEKNSKISYYNSDYFTSVFNAYLLIPVAPLCVKLKISSHQFERESMLMRNLHKSGEYFDIGPALQHRFDKFMSKRYQNISSQAETTLIKVSEMFYTLITSSAAKDKRECINLIYTQFQTAINESLDTVHRQLIANLI